MGLSQSHTAAGQEGSTVRANKIGRCTSEEVLLQTAHLQVVFGYVGLGDYCFTANVCKAWYSSYQQYCRAALAVRAWRSPRTIAEEQQQHRVPLLRHPWTHTFYVRAFAALGRLQYAHG